MDRVKLIERIAFGEDHQAELRQEVASLDDAGIDQFAGIADWLPRLMEIESAFFPPSTQRIRELMQNETFSEAERRRLLEFFDDLVFRKGKTGHAIDSAILAAVALRIIRLLARLEEIIVANDPSYRPAKTDRRELFLLIHEFRAGRLGQNGMRRLAQALQWHPGKSGRRVAVAFGQWVRQSGLSKEVGYTQLVIHALRIRRRSINETADAISTSLECLVRASQCPSRATHFRHVPV